MSQEAEFKETLGLIREMVLFNMMGQRRFTEEEELDIFDKLVDTWHIPTVRSYNLMAPTNVPEHIASHYDVAKKRPDNTITLLVALPAHYWTIDKDEIWMNRVRYNEEQEDK